MRHHLLLLVLCSLTLHALLFSMEWNYSACSANNYVATYKNEERKGGLYRTGEIKGGRDNSYSCCESCNARTALLLRYVSCCSWVNWLVATSIGLLIVRWFHVPTPLVYCEVKLDYIPIWWDFDAFSNTFKVEWMVIYFFRQNYTPFIKGVCILFWYGIILKCAIV